MAAVVPTEHKDTNDLMSSERINFQTLIKTFSETAFSKLQTEGQPEALLRRPTEELIVNVANLLGLGEAVLADEHSVSDLDVRPDWSVWLDGALVGHIEIKRPGKGADPTSFRDKHDKAQWARLSALPNVLYSDGNCWGLYRSGDRVGPIQELSSDIRNSPAKAVEPEGLRRLFERFLSWEPLAPRSLSELANTTARLCRLLRYEVEDAVQESTALQQLAEEWRDLLFPDASDEVFADQYAQTVTFALLMARAENISLGDQPLYEVARRLGRNHSLLGRALEILTDKKLTERLSTSLLALKRVLGVVDWTSLAKDSEESEASEGHSPWLYFYEDFLSVYDPDLRKDTGSYYTPKEVVGCTVRLIDDALRNRLHCGHGFASEEVVVVDPAAGTGTYLIEVAQKTAEQVRDQAGDVGGQALQHLSRRLIGFEKQVGPFAVAQLRIWETLKEYGAGLGPDETRLYVTDTLSNPYTEETRLGGFYEPIAASRRAANEVKAEERVMVVLGNPPYRNRAKGEGGWVEKGDPETQEGAILEDFRATGKHQPSGNQEQELRNLYVYFWRWALWKAFELHEDAPHGVVGFITSAAWLQGDGFIGMREHIRKLCDRLYVINLGGEGRGGRKEPNIFAIQTPVAICIAVRDGSTGEQPARVRYRRIRGTRREKLSRLTDIDSLSEEGWTVVECKPHQPIGASGTPPWNSFPLLTDILPWSAPGIKPNRTWVYAPRKDTLLRRWDRLTAETDPNIKRKLFKESYHAKFNKKYKSLPGHPHVGTIKDETGQCPDPVKVGYRSFDVQWLIPDRRVIHSPSPSLWRTHSNRQVYLAWNPKPAEGPATTYSAHMPDMPFFQGNANAGGKVIPLWRDKEATEPNVASGLLSAWSDRVDRDVSACDLFAYVAGVTAHPEFVDRFWDELEYGGVRVPLSVNKQIFVDVLSVGKEIIWLHTYGERYADPSDGRPSGRPRINKGKVPKVVDGYPIPDSPAGMPDRISFDPDSQTLHVGKGRISPVRPAVWNYEVSDMQVIPKWFSYRRKNPGGRKSSPLDRMTADTWSWADTRDLLDLLHVLTRVVSLEPTQKKLLDRVLSHEWLSFEDLQSKGVFPIGDAERTPPPEQGSQNSLNL